MKTAQELTKSIGLKIRQSRISQNMTIEQLADRCNTSVLTIKSLEKGRSVRTATMVEALIILGIDHIFDVLPDEQTIAKTRKGQPRKRAYKKIPSKLKTKLEAKRARLWGTYGLTVDEYVQMFEAQNRKCGNPGCENPISIADDQHTHIDHDHQTGKVRALLCSGCNAALGFLKENTDRMIGLAEYKKKYSALS